MSTTEMISELKIDDFACCVNPKEISSLFIRNSVTRLGKNSPLLQSFKSVLQFFRFYFMFDEIMNLIWQKFNAIGQIFTFLKGQLFKK